MTSIFEQVKAALAPRLSEVLAELLPGGRVSGREYVCASLQGGAGTSCATNLDTGKGSDFATGESWGDVIALAANPDNRVLGLVSYAWAGFGAAFGPVVLISVLWKGMTRNGALAGIVVGAITVIVWKHFELLGLYEIIPGFIFASIAILAVSVMGKGPSTKMVERFDAAEKDFKLNR